MKTESLKPKQQAVPRVKQSTHEAILKVSNELINKMGMSAFRIDSVAKQLDISPGNITYHFGRKEDIATAIWQNCSTKIKDSCNLYISPLIDIKQLYLLITHIITILYKHRGVVSHKNSDVGLIKKDVLSHKENTIIAIKYILRAYKYLIDGGYMVEIQSKSLQTYQIRIFLTNLSWSVNYMMATPQDDRYKSMALTIMHSLAPNFTPTAHAQYKSVANNITKHGQN